MAIKHKAIKASGDAGLASEWNDDHEITGDVDFNQYEAVNLVFEGLAAPPAGPIMGQTYFDTLTKEYKIWDGSTWISFIRHNGSVAFTGNQSMGTHKITDVVNPTAAQDAATKNYVDGKVSLVKGETGYWACAGCQFHADYDSSYPRQWEYLGGHFWSYTNNTEAFGSVNGIPNGSVMTGVVVYGSFSGSWRLYRRILHTGAWTEIASAAANTEDTTIKFPTIDHTTYCYFLKAEGVDVDKAVRAARIKFTYP